METAVLLRVARTKVGPCLDEFLLWYHGGIQALGKTCFQLELLSPQIICHIL